MSSAAIVSFFVLVVGVADGLAKTKDVSHNNEMDVFRLPDDTVPVSYNLSIMPDYDRRKTDAIDFDGEVYITIAVKRNTSKITLNSRRLFMYVAYVHEKTTDRTVDVVDIRYDEKNEQLAIHLESELRAGAQYTVNVEYHGSVRNGTNGLYESTYRVSDSCEE